MRILRQSDYRTTPWKNGGGRTAQIAVSPPGAGLDDFDWRVSMASVTSDGPFSVFAGVDRILAVLAGAGIAVSVGEAVPVALTRETPPFAFPADAPTYGRLTDGPIDDLNVMARRGRCASCVARLALDAPRSITLRGSETLLVCAMGVVAVETPEGSGTLGARDALLCGARHGTWRLHPKMPSLAYLVEIRYVEALAAN